MATPFHRVIFKDDTKAVEQLPEERLKAALGLRLNSFIGGNTILKNFFSIYKDDFGITAFSLENETAVKITPFFTIKPQVRFYKQTASKYFAPYKEHVPEAIFFYFRL